MKVLLYGATGWIGGYMKHYYPDAVIGQARLDQPTSVVAEVAAVEPTHVILAAGLTGRPNIDWCEDHRKEVIEVNVLGPSVLAQYCNRMGIHLTVFGTGCIYTYDSDHPIGGPGFTEEDRSNFDGSFYSRTKAFLETYLKELENVLVLRIRMPISSDLHHRSFLTKIRNYEKIVNIPNSVTILDDLIPLVPKMMEQGLTGVWNFVNPGPISHNEVLDAYKEIVDPDYTYTNFSLDDQAKILKAGRSNCHLDVSKLLAHFNVPDARVSIRRVMEKIKKG